jgi:hypothetical protein
LYKREGEKNNRHEVSNFPFKGPDKTRWSENKIGQKGRKMKRHATYDERIRAKG